MINRSPDTYACKTCLTLFEKSNQTVACSNKQLHCSPSCTAYAEQIRHYCLLTMRKTISNKPQSRSESRFGKRFRSHMVTLLPWSKIIDVLKFALYIPLRMQTAILNNQRLLTARQPLTQSLLNQHISAHHAGNMRTVCTQAHGLCLQYKTSTIFTYMGRALDWGYSCL